MRLGSSVASAFDYKSAGWQMKLRLVSFLLLVCIHIGL